MPEYSFGPWPIGMDMVSDKREIRSTRNGRQAARDANNVYFTVDGHAASRPAFERIATGNCHSLFTISDQTFFVKDGVLCRYYAGEVATIHTLTNDEPLSYAVVNGELVFSGVSQIKVYGPTGVRDVCAATPAGLAVQVATAGGLDAGKYAIAACFADAWGEGPMSPVAFVDVPKGGGMVIQNWQLGMRVYRTLANGDILYRVRAPDSFIGAGEIGAQEASHGLDPIPPGEIIRQWKGRLLSVRANTLYFSEPFRYGVCSRRYGFMRFPTAIRFLEPVDGGIFVGQSDGVLFVSGTEPKSMQVQKTESATPIARSSMILKSTSLYPMEGVSGELACWLSEKGYVLGLSNGQILSMQQSRIRLSGSRAETVLAGDKVVSIIQ